SSMPIHAQMDGVRHPTEAIASRSRSYTTFWVLITIQELSMMLRRFVALKAVDSLLLFTVERNKTSSWECIAKMREEVETSD
ncbi:hypothetical protein PENTCL1PPCAC_856, partial [Pristionchus entomophagus]